MSDFHTPAARIAVLAQIGAAASKPRLVADAIMSAHNMADMDVSAVRELLETRGAVIAIVRAWAGEYRVERNGVKTHAETGAELVTRTLRNRLNKILKAAQSEEAQSEEAQSEEAQSEEAQPVKFGDPITLTMGDATMTVSPADDSTLYSNLFSLMAAQSA